MLQELSKPKPNHGQVHQTIATSTATYDAIILPNPSSHSADHAMEVKYERLFAQDQVPCMSRTESTPVTDAGASEDENPTAGSTSLPICLEQFFGNTSWTKVQNQIKSNHDQCYQ